MAGSGSKWEDKGGTPRLRGRKAVEQRRRRLALEPLCRDCKAKGLIRAADVIDHIVPLALGGSDEDANTRALCQPCHMVRTREQFGLREVRAVGLDGWPAD
jgi:5-methylcytosine-specific restriction protein A